MPKGIRKDPDITNPQYLHMYGYNLWRWLANTKPNPAYRGRCIICRKTGILGWDLIHRGPMRRTTLICGHCYKEAQ